MAKHKVAVVVGSNRAQSINRKLAQALTKLGDGRLEFRFAQIDDLPMYNQDHEAALPEPVSARPGANTSGPGTGAAVTGATPGSIGTAVAQQHLKSVLSDLGATVMGGESYITFKPDLIGDDDRINDNSTKAFLQGFVDQFTSLVERAAVRA